MARIIEIDDLVPEDILFVFQGEEYPVRGDITVERVLQLTDLLRQLDEAEDEPTQGKVLLKIEEHLLHLFQERTPDLEVLPFGIQGITQVLLALLRQVGAISEEEEPDAEADPPKGKRTTPSTPSTGSRSSSANSASRRTTTKR